MKTTRFLAMATLALATGLCAAQGTTSPAKKELVQKVLQLQQQGVENTARMLVDQSIAPLGQQAGMILQTRVPPEQREALTRELQGEFRKFADEALPLLRDRAQKLAPATLGAMLEERLSEDELKQVITMLESPIYRKYQQLGPEMQRALTEKLVADTRPQIGPKLQALQQAVGKHLNAATQGAKPASGPAAKAAPARAPASAAKN